MTEIDVPRSAVHVPHAARYFRRRVGQVSLVIVISVTCETCGVQFAEQVLLVLDELERPDLWARARPGGLARFTCPSSHDAPDDTTSVILRDRHCGLLFVAGDAVSRDLGGDGRRPAGYPATGNRRR